jgi:hypothetical protein
MRSIKRNRLLNGVHKKYKNKIMKNETKNLTLDIFKMFTLSTEEMISVRGGESDPIVKTTTPPVKI